MCGVEWTCSTIKQRSLDRPSLAFPTGGSLFAILDAGLLSTTIGWLLLSSAIQHVPATLAGLFLLLQPALALVWEVVVFGKPTGLIEATGMRR
ncbi:EamA family transporter [Geothermobacter ehrlichii]|uniref:EamA family transporter n=1 Tax=Geothermobacter ehrlichii TaxID=213224 RepID=UPI0011E67699|nr:EamA family transporter [Geothermobacter ehrlichii]